MIDGVLNNGRKGEGAGEDRRAKAKAGEKPSIRERLRRLRRSPAAQAAGEAQQKKLPEA